MINIKKYVPILRWRPAEMAAVQKLFPQDRENITPLIEFIMPAPKTDKENYKKILADSKEVFQKRLPEVAEQILKYCGRATVFVDVHLLDGDIRASTLDSVLQATSVLDLFAIPVIYIIPVTSTDADMATRTIAIKHAKKSNSGLCIRVDESHFSDEKLPDHLIQFVQDNGLQMDAVDILVDLKIVDNATKAETVAQKLALLPQIDKWRSVILTGGSFPSDLSDFEKHSHNKIDRLDLKLWKEIVNNNNIRRKPIYSDYTIQHPIHHGHILGANTSASIRYTDDEQWEIWRGEGIRNKKGAGHKQYPAHAQLLIKQKSYKGTTYSYGDDYINERAKLDNQKTGNPTSWLTVGINHHITLTSRQISNLS